MAVGRLPAGHDPCHNHPVILQSCMVTEMAIVPIQVRGPKRIWIASTSRGSNTGNCGAVMVFCVPSFGDAIIPYHAAVAAALSARRWSSRSATPSGCWIAYVESTATPLMLTSLDRGKADPADLHRRHRPAGHDELARIGPSDNRSAGAHMGACWAASPESLRLPSRNSETAL